jgi:hypothetical protein
MKNGLHTARIFFALFALCIAVEIFMPAYHTQYRLADENGQVAMIYTKVCSSLLLGDVRDLLIAFGFFDDV